MPPELLQKSYSLSLLMPLYFLAFMSVTALLNVFRLTLESLWVVMINAGAL